MDGRFMTSGHRMYGWRADRWQASLSTDLIFLWWKVAPAPAGSDVVEFGGQQAIRMVMEMGEHPTAQTIQRKQRKAGGHADSRW